MGKSGTNSIYVSRGAPPRETKQARSPNAKPGVPLSDKLLRNRWRVLEASRRHTARARRTARRGAPTPFRRFGGLRAQEGRRPGLSRRRPPAATRGTRGELGRRRRDRHRDRTRTPPRSAASTSPTPTAGEDQDPGAGREGDRPRHRIAPGPPPRRRTYAPALRPHIRPPPTPDPPGPTHNRQRGPHRGRGAGGRKARRGSPVSSAPARRRW